MTFDNNQISTILLLVETSQLQEPELSEAWALLKHIQDQQMIETNYPVCDGCDCVAACSKVKDKACLSAVQPPTAQPAKPTGYCPALTAQRQESVQRVADFIARQPAAQPVQPADLAIRIKREIDHCVMNDLRLIPYFGKMEGELAVRVSSLEAILETSATTQPQQSAAMPEFERYDWDYDCMGEEEDGRYVLYDNVAAVWPKGTS